MSFELGRNDLSNTYSTLLQGNLILQSYTQMLVLDEADQCLSMGFADTMNCILEELPEDRQTMLFSATQTRSVINRFVPQLSEKKHNFSLLYLLFSLPF